MHIQRGDVTRINENDRGEILSQLGVSTQDLVAKGTEAEVYGCGDDRVLKIYADAQRVPHLATLRDFYASIDESACGLALPRIHRIVAAGEAIGVLESRIPGVALDGILGQLQGEALERGEELYFQAVDTLRCLKMLREPETYLLFDQTGRSSTRTQSWSEFYATLLQEKLEKVGAVLESVVPDFRSRQQRLRDALAADTQLLALSVVHGDFFAGNVMVEPDLSRVTGIIDFGSFTLFGDHVLDVAGAFGNYKMYEPNRRKIREELLPKALALLAPAEHGKFFRYLLANAVLTCDLYVIEADLRENGHFRWAAEVFSEKRYWDALA